MGRWKRRRVRGEKGTIPQGPKLGKIEGGDVDARVGRKTLFENGDSPLCVMCCGCCYCCGCSGGGGRRAWGR